MPIEKEFLIIIHQEPEIDTIGELVGRTDAGKLFFTTATELLNLDGGTGKTNRERVKEKYTRRFAKEVEDDNPSDENTPILVNTELVVANSKLNRETLAASTYNTVKSTDAQAFMAGKLVELHQDTGYIKVVKQNDGLGTVRSEIPQLSVWMWVRALSPIRESSDPDGLSGSLIDVTPFVQNVETNVGINGGNFSITLTPLICEGDPNEGWVIKKSSIKNYNANSLRTNYVAQGHVHKLEGGNLKENQFFFHNIINSNDLVFIRFETLETESLRRLNQGKNKGITNLDLPNNIYDMIGLVDTNTKSDEYQGDSIEVGINITGRDLSKTIIDDGSYFFPLEFAKGVFYNASKRNKDKQESGLIRRNVATGALISLNAYLERSIQFTLEFIITQLSNTGLVPSSVFDAYSGVINQDGERRDTRSKRFALKEKGDSVKASLKPLNGVWQIIKLVIDDSVADRRIVDSSIATEQGSLMNSIKKICQEPFVEFFTDTYGDQFYFIVRTPPFDRTKIINILDGNVTAKDGNVNPGPSKKVAKSERDIRLDIQALEPDVENQKLDEKYLSKEKPEGKIRTVNDGALVIDVETSDILSKSLQYSDTDVYTWFRITPKALLFGAGGSMSLALLPAINLPRYEEIWGSKAMDITTTYTPFRAIGDKNQKQKQNFIEKQTFYDLKWLIDTHSYLPFTRKGTITINRDRRIKRGSFIRLKQTSEIFYITAVSHTHTVNSQTINATTTIQVERGMVEEYIKGKILSLKPGAAPQLVSYFNIVDTTLNEKLFEIDDNGERKLNESVLERFGVNDEIFDFFFKRQQWNDNVATQLVQG